MSGKFGKLSREQLLQMYARLAYALINDIDLYRYRTFNDGIPYYRDEDGKNTSIL